jgi:uncharacterized protein
MIIDRRINDKIHNTDNRSRFLDRQRKAIKSQIKAKAANRKIKNINKKTKIKSDKESLNEPSIGWYNKGKHSRVYPGNKEFWPGDEIPKEGGGQGRGEGDGDDDFSFFLSSEDFVNYLMEDLELPEFVKEGLAKSKDIKRFKGGYSKTGNPARLSVKKTYEQALTRKMAAKNSKIKVPFLEEDDLSDIHVDEKKVPIKAAVMVCLMDVSGSMDEKRKYLAKIFFWLLYMFLQRNYTDVELVFVKYHHEAKECTEEEFFYDAETGGTILATGLNEVRKIIEDRYNSNRFNVYLAHVSDGDHAGTWNPVLRGNQDLMTSMKLLEKIIPTLQYAAYLQVTENEKDETGVAKVIHLYKALQHKGYNVGYTVGTEERDIFPAFRELFEKGIK